MKKYFYKLLGGWLKRRNIYLTGGLYYLYKPPLLELNSFDYVRVATLELVASEINSSGVSGAVAELGVYRGGFAKYVNQVFSARTFFLFDTFEGFDERDREKGHKAGVAEAHQDFTNTSAEAVLHLMPFRHRCVVRKGYFPDSFAGLEKENFAFVSIDADLYEPILRGLELFYPRLAPGGCIMVHDYNNKNYPGCRKAVLEYCMANNISTVPVPDIGGTIVIRKPFGRHG